jgi:hypothetical protein
LLKTGDDRLQHDDCRKRNSNTQFSGYAWGNGVVTGHANTTGNIFGSSFTVPNRRGKARVLAIKFV